MRMLSSLRRLVWLACVVVVLPVPAWAQTALPLGTPQQGKVSSEAPTEYTFAAKTAGLLGVAVQGDGDLAFSVTDEDGQQLPDGNVDRDLNGSEGTEMVSMLISEPGTYKVRVRVQGGSSATFSIGGSWLSFPPFARASSDPDRRPRSAHSIVVGKAHEDALDSESGDLWDWFVMKPAQAGTLAIVTRRVGEGDSDLVLEVYLDGNFASPADRSDQDLQGNNANESVTVNVNAGQAVHVKVAGAFSRVSTKYRVSSSLIP
jgi:uncharacterized protein YfaP (DUF2135 family)